MEGTANQYSNISAAAAGTTTKSIPMTVKSHQLSAIHKAHKHLPANTDSYKTEKWLRSNKMAAV